jgi:hypothetical protein
MALSEDSLAQAFISALDASLVDASRAEATTLAAAEATTLAAAPATNFIEKTLTRVDGQCLTFTKRAERSNSATYNRTSQRLLERTSEWINAGSLKLD